MADERQKKIRSFLAINLPEDVKESIGKAVSELKQKNTNSAFRLVGKENIDLTLHFFGDLTEEKITALQKPLTDLFLKHNAFTLRSEGFGFFPNRELPRVFYLGLEGTHELFSLVSDLKQLLTNLNYEVDPRPFQPHLTLARIKGGTQCRTEQVSVTPFSFSVKSIELMSSKLTRSGPIYSVLYSFPLG